MDPLYQYAWLVPALPLAGAALVGTGLIAFNSWTNRLRQVNAALIMSLLGVALGYSLALFWSQVQGHGAFHWQFTWAVAGSFHLEMGYVIDRLTSLMLVIVTSVALLVMLYSDGYMAHDPSYVRFFTYLSLFSFSMLGLVMSPNLVQIYVFWELVGMCSYLLIGFWYDRVAAREACQKAFVVNRVGDFGLLLGMLGLFWCTGSFEFGVIGERLEDLMSSGSLGTGLATLLVILVFLGPVAKSAQFPLHVWLPDAMEGPTPISALIHAATMVAAGVFLLARLEPILEHLPGAMAVVAWTGAFTAFLGASIAITQNDIKKGLAYSTISQLGYMVMAMGLGAYGAGLFHLMTHAFFKAMLFLGSGSVIHGMEAVVGHNPALAQDMRYMGGLRKHMPVTATTFLIGTLAICGVPPLAGFWSKDEILGSALAANPALWGIGWLTAGITAFYMFRMYFMTFEGEFRGLSFGPGAMRVGELSAEEGGHGEPAGRHAAHPHESPWTMVTPLVILAVPSVLIGLLGTPFANYFEAFLEGHSPLLAEPLAAEVDWQEFGVTAGSSVAIATLGILVALIIYRLHRVDPAQLALKLKPLYEFSLNKWYLDDLYERVFAQGCRQLARQALEMDYRIIDGVVNLTGLATLLTGEGLKYIENGRVQTYALVILLAVLSLVLASGLA